MAPSSLETFVKLPLGGVDKRAIVSAIRDQGPVVARADLARDRAALRPAGMTLPEGSCVLLLGGSGGILRALAVQLVFGERIPVFAVHYDSEKLQIGPQHAAAITEAAKEIGVPCEYTNADATKPDVIQAVTARLKERFRTVHLVNGIAAGATKRFAQHGPAKVREIEVAFDPVRQIVDFSTWDNFRRAGLVDVEIATEADCERTYKFMGSSTGPWADALGAAGLLTRGESVVAFTDYQYEHDDPVYAMGPLRRAKDLHRESLRRVEAQHGVRVARICYPAMNTTALGAIPGGTLMFAGTASVLLEHGKYKNLAELARETLPIFDPAYRDFDVPLDTDYQSLLMKFHARKASLCAENARDVVGAVFGYAGL